MVVQLPELARDVRPQLRSSLAEVGCGLHHPLGWNVGVHLDDNIRHAVAVPPLGMDQTNSMPPTGRCSGSLPSGRSPTPGRADGCVRAMGTGQSLSAIA